MIVRPLAVAACFAVATAAVVACGSFTEADTATDLDGGGPVEGGPIEGAMPPDGAEIDSGAANLTPVELARGFVDLAAIAATATNVYFAEKTPGTVNAVPMAGGAVTQIANTGGAPSAMAVIGSDLYWCDNSKQSITRQPLSGAPSTSKTPTPGKVPFAISPTANGFVTMTIDKDSIGEMQQYSLDITIGPVVSGLVNPVGVAVAGNEIYWTESGAARVGRGTVGDSSTAPVASNESDCESIAADSQGVYWARRSESTVRAIIKGSPGIVSLATNETQAASLAADGAALYWLTADGAVRRLRHAAGSVVETVAVGSGTSFMDARVQAIALTSTDVVWLTTDGRVLRHAK